MTSGDPSKIAHINILTIDKVPATGMGIQGNNSNITPTEGTKKILVGETESIGNKRSTICTEDNNKSFIIRPVQDTVPSMTKN